MASVPDPHIFFVLTTNVPSSVMTIETALDVAQIPQSYAALPGIQSSGPLIYIPLGPDGEYCMTNYLESDVRDMYDLYHIPTIANCLIRTHFAEVSLDDARVKVAEKIGWRLPAIRLTRDIGENIPRLLGIVHFKPDLGLITGNTENARRMKLKGLRSDEEAYWIWECFLHPDFRVRGIISTAARYVMNEWLVKVLKIKAGQIVSGWMESNSVSRRMQEALGFKAVAIIPPEVWTFGKPLIRPAERVIACVWQGAGRCELDESCYAGLDPWP